MLTIGFIALKSSDTDFSDRIGGGFAFALEESYPEGVDIRVAEEEALEELAPNVFMTEQPQAIEELITTELITEPPQTTEELTTTELITEVLVNETSSSKVDPVETFPWLQSILKENGTVDLPSGKLLHRLSLTEEINK